jgi:hypothetical protein
MKQTWDDAPALLAGLREAVGRTASGVDASYWLIDEGTSARPGDLQALETGGAELHVIEMQGGHGRDRAFTTALGHILFEREEAFDAFLLLDVSHHRNFRELEPLFEAFHRHPGAVAIAPGGPARRTPPLAHRARRLLLRALCGESLYQSPALLLPTGAAEALCESSHGITHVEAALSRLGVPLVRAAMPRLGCGFDAIAAATVFRDRVFARIFRFTGFVAFFCAILALVMFGMRLAGARSFSPEGIAVVAVCAALAGSLSLLALQLAVFSRALGETRRSTPAIDSTLFIRGVTRVRRQPYAVEHA